MKNYREWKDEINEFAPAISGTVSGARNAAGDMAGELGARASKALQGLIAGIISSNNPRLINRIATLVRQTVNMADDLDPTMKAQILRNIAGSGSRITHALQANQQPQPQQASEYVEF